ncbi:MAG: YggS family pyridoxal phosphate-dependent enzyme [Kibdelosporangium sp.]
MIREAMFVRQHIGAETAGTIPAAAAGPDPAGRLETVRRSIADACVRANRSPQEVTLVAAAKTVPGHTLNQAITAGQTVFGENRVQEALSKWPSILAESPHVELHLIGPLQSNKVRDAVALFDAIHSVDRAGLCVALARQSQIQGRQPKLFVQVNTGAEPQKSGVLPGDADRFLADCRGSYGLHIAGLMCVPPFGDPPEPHFTMLADIAERNGLELLSMGMSTDYTSAIEHGATHVRVGSAIFGARTTG